MTIKELAEYLQLEEHTIYKMARKGEIPAYKLEIKKKFVTLDILNNSEFIYNT